MSLLKSVFFGCEGRYKIFGVDVTFRKGRHDGMKLDIDSNSSFWGFRTVCILNQAYLHTLIHEMGHAVATKIIAKYFPRITIFQDNAAGFTGPTPNSHPYEPIITFAGPMTTMAVSGSILIAFFALRNPIFPLGHWFAWGAVASMMEESYNNFLAFYDKQDGGDLACLARRSPKLLTTATCAMIGSIALTFLGAYHFSR